MRRLFFVLVLLGLAIPAAVQAIPSPQCAPPPGLEARAGSPDALASALTPMPARLAAQISSRPLFLDVEGLSGARLTARFLVDGAPWVVETFAVPAAEGRAVVAKSCAELSGKSAVERPTKELLTGTPVVELLGREPGLLDRAREMAAKDPERVRIEIRREGQVLRSLPLVELQAESEALRSQPILPRPVSSKLRGKGLDAATAPSNAIVAKETCEGFCEDQYQQCLLNQICQIDIPCDQCDIEYQDCLAGCEPPPTCQEKVEYFYDTYLYAVFPSGWSECFPDPWGYYDGVWHDEWVYVFRTDYVEKTTHTDCSVTYRLLDYWYDYFYCFDWTYWPCYSPWYPWNLCYW